MLPASNVAPLGTIGARSRTTAAGDRFHRSPVAELKIGLATSHASAQFDLFDDDVEQHGNPGPQRGEITLDDVPNQREINTEVFVDQLVAHPGDLAPRD